MAKIVINVEDYGVIHYYAQCEVCDWDAAYRTDVCETRKDVRLAVHRHIRETGHPVNIESGRATRYTAV